MQVHITRTPGIKLFQIQDWVREKLGLRIPTTAAERIHQAPANAFLATSLKRNRKVLFSAFEAAFFAFYRLNDGKGFSQTIYYEKKVAQSEPLKGQATTTCGFRIGGCKNLRLDTASSSMCFTLKQTQLIALNSQ